MRLEGWPERVAEKIEEARTAAFEWGKHDCFCFAGGVAEVITGEDPFAWYQGSYRTASGIRKNLKKLCYASIEALVAEELGEPIQPTLARRGDMVGLKTDDKIGCALGICTGAHAVFVTIDGITTMPMAACYTAWRVG